MLIKSRQLVNFSAIEDKNKRDKQESQREKFHGTVNKMLIKSRKLVNFSAIEDKKEKSQTREPESVKTQKRPGSGKTSRLQ